MMETKRRLLKYDKSIFTVNPELNSKNMPMSNEQKKSHDLLNNFFKNAKKKDLE